MAAQRFAPSRSRRPITCTRTPCCTQREVSFSRYAAIRRISASTSAGGRRQLSLEKAKSVRIADPGLGRGFHHAARRFYPGAMAQDPR